MDQQSAQLESSEEFPPHHPANNDQSVKFFEDLIAYNQHYLNRNDSASIKTCHCDTYSKFFRAGPFVLGGQLSESPFPNIDRFIARKIGDPNPNRHFLLKIVVLPKCVRAESHTQRQAKLLLYNEYSVLSMLNDQDGVIHYQGLYMDHIFDQSDRSVDDSAYICEKCSNCDSVVDVLKDQDVNFKCKHLKEAGLFKRRLILAFECYIPHMFHSLAPPFLNKFNRYPKLNSDYENLQEYVKRYKNIPELKALQIFYQIVKVIYSLHKKNIAHRDLRLENILYNHRNGRILLVNFGLARYVINDSTCINDHRGSSAYISPDVLKRLPYNPKASDCWALGVIFYTMLFGKFPFYADNFSDLFKKINSGKFCLPPANIWESAQDLIQYSTFEKYRKDYLNISSFAKKLINSLIVTDAQERMNIVELKKKIKNLIYYNMKVIREVDNHFGLKKNGTHGDDCDLQVVPQLKPRVSESSSFHRFKSIDKHCDVLQDHNYSKFSEYKGSSSHRPMLSDNLHHLAPCRTNVSDRVAEPPSQAKPSPYFSLESKFYLKFDESPYEYTIHNNRTNPIFLQNRDISTTTASSSSSSSCEGEKRKRPLSRDRFPFKRTRSDFSVHKVDGDLRSLTEHEAGLFGELTEYY